MTNAPSASLIRFTIPATVDFTDWRGARAPAREPLDGETMRLEPLDPARHGEALFAAADGADESWYYLPYGPFADQEQFMLWLSRHAATADPMAFAVIDRSTGRAVGIATFMSIVPEHGVIEIGHLWFSPLLQRTRAATETIFVMSRHAFDDLGNRRLEWKCDAANAASRRAAERFGFMFEGVFRQHRVIKGRNRDTAWFSITDSEWPSRRSAFEAWLSTANFDETGAQRRSLSELRAGILSQR